MRTDSYRVRVGSRRANTPAPDLYSIPFTERLDDGRAILHVGDHTPTCSDCGRGRLLWAEAGYVPWHRICELCGSHWKLHPLGMMGIALIPQREEPACGRDRLIDDPCPDCDGPSEEKWCERCEATGRVQRPDPARTCYHGSAVRCAERAAGMDEVTAAAVRVTLRCACCCHVPPSQRRVVGTTPSVWINGEGWVPIDPTWPVNAPLERRYIPDAGHDAECPGTWGDLIALVRPEHVAEAERERERTLGVPCVPACWARRARFY